jgi:hypothetical protein
MGHPEIRVSEAGQPPRPPPYVAVMVIDGLVKPHRVAEIPLVPVKPVFVVPSPLEILERICVFEMFHVTSLVTFCGVAFPANVAITVKVIWPPFGTLVGLAVTVMFVTAGQTLTVAVLVAVPSVAVMVVTPGGLLMTAAAITFPSFRPIVATEVSDDVQRHFPETFDVLPSLKVPVATIWSVPLGARVWPLGPTVMLVNVGFTKKPLQLTAKARAASAARAPIRRSLCFVDDIVM